MNTDSSRLGAEAIKLLWQQSQQLVRAHAVKVKRQVQLIEQCGQPTGRPLHARTRAALERFLFRVVIKPRRQFDDAAIGHEFFTRSKLLHNFPRFPRRIAQHRDGALRLVTMRPHNQKRPKQKVTIDPLVVVKRWHESRLVLWIAVAVSVRRTYLVEVKQGEPCPQSTIALG